MGFCCSSLLYKWGRFKGAELTDYKEVIQMVACDMTNTCSVLSPSQEAFLSADFKMGWCTVLKDEKTQAGWPPRETKASWSGENLWFPTWRTCGASCSSSWWKGGKPWTILGDLELMWAPCGGVFEVSTPRVHWGQQAEVKLYCWHRPASLFPGNSRTAHFIVKA